jgi:hypothetical protein
MMYYPKSNELIFTDEHVKALAKAHRVLARARDLLEHVEDGIVVGDNHYSIVVAEGRLADIIEELTPGNGLDVGQ